MIAFDRTSYATLGQFGTNGVQPGQMITPSGIDHDAAGNLYVVDQDGGRVQRFGWGPLPAPETVKPTIDVDLAAAGRTAPSAGHGRRRGQGPAGRGPDPRPDDRQVLERDRRDVGRLRHLEPGGRVGRAGPPHVAVHAGADRGRPTPTR